MITRALLLTGCCLAAAALAQNGTPPVPAETLAAAYRDPAWQPPRTGPEHHCTNARL